MPDYAESLPPTIRRMWTPTEDSLCLVVWNLNNKKGIALRTTRAYIVFAQTLRKFVGKAATAEEIREGLRCLIDCGTTVHGDYLFYLAYEQDRLPYDALHDVSPMIVMDSKYRTNGDIAEMLELNTEQFPARLARPDVDTDLVFTTPPVAGETEGRAINSTNESTSEKLEL